MRRLGFYTIAVAASAVATAVLGDAVLRINIARREHLGQLPGQAIAPLDLKQASRVRAASFGCASCHRADLAASMGLFCRLARG